MKNFGEKVIAAANQFSPFFSYRNMGENQLSQTCFFSSCQYIVVYYSSWTLLNWVAAKTIVYCDVQKYMILKQYMIFKRLFVIQTSKISKLTGPNEL